MDEAEAAAIMAIAKDRRKRERKAARKVWWDRQNPWALTALFGIFLCVIVGFALLFSVPQNVKLDEDQIVRVEVGFSVLNQSGWLILAFGIIKGATWKPEDDA